MSGWHLCWRVGFLFLVASESIATAGTKTSPLLHRKLLTFRVGVGRSVMNEQYQQVLHRPGLKDKKLMDSTFQGISGVIPDSGPWGVRWCKMEAGWSQIDSIARLCAMWRDLGPNLVLHCLIGWALMWLSNQADCWLMNCWGQRVVWSALTGFHPKSCWKTVFEV